jgi:hypothetical protein
VNRRKPIMLMAGVITNDDIRAISAIGVAFFVLKPEVFNIDVLDEVFSLVGIKRIRQS